MKVLLLWVISIHFVFPDILQGIAIQDSVITGRVLDEQTLDPVPGAHVYTEGMNNGTVTGEDGSFVILFYHGSNRLVFSHVGFRNSILELTNIEFDSTYTVYLAPVPIRNDDIIITAGRMNMRYSGIYSDTKTRAVEDHMRSVPGLDMVTRANFAKDPVIRGLRDSRVDVMIDGMRLTAACVDGMDPATAYIESDNLQAIEINRGQENQSLTSTAPGGSVNFAMARPLLNSGLSGSAETGYQAVSSQRSAAVSFMYGDETWAFRLSGTYRNAGDLQPGNGPRIPGSGLEKGNVYTAILYQPKENHRFNMRYIGDFAGEIGYPMLLMDTRRADAHIAGLEYYWANPTNLINSVTTNIYLNRVEHWMDDYGRDVGQRDVMRNMYMPMYGETTTAGFSTEFGASTGSHLMNLKFEAYSISAFADMLMEHTDPNIRDMYLVNVGDVSQRNGLMGTAYRYFTDNNWILGVNARAEIGFNRIREASAIATYQAEYPGLSSLEPIDIGYSFGISAEKRLTEKLSASARISDGKRLPGHLERYGYYIYQPLDGFFYYGNPGLRPERSSQAEFFITFGSEFSRVNGSTSVWYNRMENYIAGKRMDSNFKRYENMGMATLTGFEADLSVRLASKWSSGATFSFVYGNHNELNEPLPMIPPLKGSVSIQRESEIVSFESRFRWAAAQKRVAEQNSHETRTGGHTLWDVLARVHLTDYLTLQFGAENLLNTHYTDHLSVNSMPGAGRNIYGSIRVFF